MKISIHKIMLSLIMLVLLLPAHAQIPDRPNPPRLVNDFTNLLSKREINYLEKKLVAFNDTTSNQITLVIVPDFGGLDKASFAYEIGEQWKVGQSQFDNGVVIALRPKTSRKNGEVYIATGYGLEPVIPDAIANQIVDREMIPNFQQDRYFEGLNQATDVLMSLASKEFSSDEYAQRGNGSAGFLVPILVFIIIAFVMRGSSQNSGRTYGRSGSRGNGLLAALLLMNMGGRSSGSWNDFSSGSGGFGGGGFGGFGGGSFGGGGAGGSW